MSTSRFRWIDQRFLKECQLGLAALGPTLVESAPNISAVRSALPVFQAEVLRKRLRLVNERYLRGGDRSVLEECVLLLDEFKAYGSEDYSLHLLRAMCAFVLRRDLVDAHLEIEKCRGERDAGWRYSKGFLLAYEGKLDEAWSYYRQAFRYPSIDNTMIVQVEEFIQLIIEKEPAKVQLYFVLGMINRMAKKDFISARRDLQKFLDNTAKSEYVVQRDVAVKWIAECEAA